MDNRSTTIRDLLNSSEALDWVLDQLFELMEPMDEGELRVLADEVASAEVAESIKQFVTQHVQWRLSEEPRWLRERVPKWLAEVQAITRSTDTAVAREGEGAAQQAVPSLIAWHRYHVGEASAEVQAQCEYWLNEPEHTLARQWGEWVGRQVVNAGAEGRTRWRWRLAEAEPVLAVSWSEKALSKPCKFAGPSGLTLALTSVRKKARLTLTIDADNYDGGLVTVVLALVGRPAPIEVGELVPVAEQTLTWDEPLGVSWKELEAGFECHAFWSPATERRAALWQRSLALVTSFGESAHRTIMPPARWSNTRRPRLAALGFAGSQALEGSATQLVEEALLSAEVPWLMGDVEGARREADRAAVRAGARDEVLQALHRALSQPPW